MSIAGGVWRAVERAREVDATALQIFVKSSNQWAARPFGEGEVEAFRRAIEQAGLGPFTMAHASYLINLASPDAALWRRSKEALLVEVERCNALGVPFLVLHPGSHVGQGEARGLRRVTRALDAVLGNRRSGRVPPATEPTSILLELTAGQGTNLGHRYEHLAEIIEGCRHGDRLGVCFDTCHALAAGYDFTRPAAFRATFREFDRVVGLDRLRALHLNDSKFPLGSRRDRHEHIGEGAVGREAFRLILRDRRLRKLPMVLETPKEEDGAGDRRNLALLRELAAG